MNLSIGTIAALAAVVFAAASPAFAYTQPIPEPASLALVATGIGAVMVVRKLRKR